MLDGRQAGDGFGSRVAGAGDVDDDGKADFVIGAERSGGAAGRMEVYSGATGRVLYYFTGQGTDALGISVAGAGDVTGDGHDDVIVGAIQGGAVPGYALVFSGKPVVSLAFGRGCPGTGGLVPQIRGFGLPTLGNASHRVDLLLGNRLAPAILMMGADLLAAPVAAACLLLPTPDITVAVATGSAGTALVPLPIPNLPELIGAGLINQFAVYDPAGTVLGLLSMSDGLHLLVGR
jgi:hypothetical protein